MASADFSRQALLHDCECYITYVTSVRSPRVLTRSFPPCPHHLYCAGFRAAIGLRLVEQPYPPGSACKWFLFVGAEVCLHLPSTLLNLTARALVFSCILPTAGRIWDFHPLERAPAGRTQKNRVPSCTRSGSEGLSLCKNILLLWNFLSINGRMIYSLKCSRKCQFFL